MALAPVDDAHVPQLAVALEGARAIDSGSSPDAVSDVHVWLTTDRRVVDGDATRVRWPTPAEEGSEVVLGRTP